MSEKEGHHARRFSAEGDFVGRLEGPERRRLVPQEEIISLMGLSTQDTVLDLGAGIGYFSILASERAGRVIALDIEPKMLEVLTERIASGRIGNIELLRGDITSIPVAAGSVDHVLAAFVYHEVPDPGKLLRECARVLAADGQLTVVDFQKRETPIGPPVEERKTPSEVVKGASKEFALFSKHEAEVYYALRFDKR